MNCLTCVDIATLLFQLSFQRHCVIYGAESWSGAMEWSFGVDFEVEWSQILSFYLPPRTGF